MEVKNQIILIAEDDAAINHSITEQLKLHGYRNVHSVMARSEADAWLQNNLPDIAILDIEMESRYDGIDIGNLLSSKSIPVIFLTSHAEEDIISRILHIEQATFLSKPFRKEELLANLSMVLTRQAAKNSKNGEPYASMAPSSKHLHVSHNGIKRRIAVQDISFVKADNVYLEVHTLEGKYYLIRSTMEAFVEQLPKDTFARIHRSYLANLTHVTRRSGKTLFVNHIGLPVSRTYMDSVMEKLLSL